jgi:hypothetical protein
MPDADGMPTEAEYLDGRYPGAQEEWEAHQSERQQEQYEADRRQQMSAIPVTWIDASGKVMLTVDDRGTKWWQQIDGEWREYVEEDDARGSTGRAGHDPGDSG